jgi:hypothetical protein
MDDVLQNNFFPSSIRKINLCRLFLQVESLAEICNTTGNSILVSVWKGQRPASKSRSRWPGQARPHEPSWQLCRRRFVRLICLHPSRQTANARSTDLRLDHNLGPWIGSRHLVARRWPTYLSTYGERLFHCHNNILRCSSRIALRTWHANKFPRPSNPAPSLPTDVIPVAVQLTPAIAIVCPTPFPLLISDPSIAPVLPPPAELFDMVKTLPHWQSSPNNTPIVSNSSLKAGTRSPSI